MLHDDTFETVEIPGLGAAEIPVVESLLTSSAVWFQSSQGYRGALYPRVLIRVRDRGVVRELLKNIRVRKATQLMEPIPW